MERGTLPKQGKLGIYPAKRDGERGSQMLSLKSYAGPHYAEASGASRESE